LGLLLSGGPESAGFRHGVNLARAAMRRGVEVYVYCIDEAVLGLGESGMEGLRSGGARVYGCAYAAERRGLRWRDEITYGGLALLSDLMTRTDRFVAMG
jgi:sulfur relay (sulfurtransferase) complex TusBCD TusD component (DsrE family)